MKPFLRIMLPLAVFASASAAGSAQRIMPAVPSPEDVPIALLIDLSSGQTLLERDADRRFVPASITKVMTVFTAFELMEEGRLFPDQVITVSDKMFEEWHGVGSTMFLPAKGRVTVDELLLGITTVSANDGAAVLAEGAAGSVDKWLALMNAKAREIGMRDSHFGTPNGWPDEGRTYVSARDLATLTQAIFARHPSKYRHYFGHQGMRFNGIAQNNHDPITGRVRGADGIKTGFTNQAGYGFLGTALRDGRRLVMVVAAVESGSVRGRAARELMEWGFLDFDSRQLFAKDQVVGTARVQNGGVANVPLLALGQVNVTVPRGISPEVDLAIRYEGPLQAPIEKGERVAELQIKVAGMPTSTLPLIAGEAVTEATLIDRLFNGIGGLFS